MQRDKAPIYSLKKFLNKGRMPSIAYQIGAKGIICHFQYIL